MVVITSSRLDFSILTSADVSKQYVDWLNDPRVNKFLETNRSVVTKENCINYVQSIIEDPSSHLFKIIVRETGNHIGNIKLGPEHAFHKTAHIALFLGDVSCWGAGYGTEAITRITEWGFDERHLECIQAGVYDENLGSLRAFLKCEYTVEGYLKNNRVSVDGRRVGVFQLAKHKANI